MNQTFYTIIPEYTPTVAPRLSAHFMLIEKTNAQFDC